ncbi:MFS transporter [Aerococcus kribbianus]|uniref:Glycoside-pentoside-hexuronide (GPH):cation symporter n=1 Tax=Aerococcus kribbianus TaxID=2999064 RepID=A0A9X3JEV3_9LACT|nr:MULTISPECIES: glycoside-pentoside-hexuronide (GPH):cation symporter [unclassified Aerococcus]MCZ0717529.1 glycoside-pentoside-hexuronide (GPH):cation symporter [Aerococcus sp. YH-aer221]MCZ0725817.1 glycoside-pentoside-hexuronide (GPH):cation symporter [Aerococcus sp. YH-aer222]
MTAIEEKYTPETNKLSWKHRVGYAAGDAGGVVTLVMAQTYMNRYITNIVGVSFETLSILLIVWNIWDALNDPLMGNIIDRLFEHRKASDDKFRPWILASIPIICLGLIALFSAPSHLKGILALATLFITKIIYEAGYTMINIAMGSIQGVMAVNDTERATLSSFRGLGSNFGALVGSIAISQVLAHVGESQFGYMIASIVAASLAAVLIFTHYIFTEERNEAAKYVDEHQDSVKFSDIWSTLRQNPAYVALIVHSIFLSFGEAMYNGTSSYMVADVFGNIGLLSIASIVQVTVSVIILIFVPKLVQFTNGSVNLLRIIMAISITLFVSLFFSLMIAELPGLVYIIWAGSAATLLNLGVQLQWGLLAESVDYNQFTLGKRNEGTLYGSFMFSRRLGQTIAQSLVVLIISWIGYNPDLTNAGLRQAESTIRGLSMTNLIGPALGALGSILAFTIIWNINDEVRKEISQFKQKQAQLYKEEIAAGKIE